MIYNLRSEQQWLEEDNKIQREEKEKSQKNLADLERSAKLKEHNLKKRVTKAEGVGRRYQTKAQKCCSEVERAQRKTSLHKRPLHVTDGEA